MNSQFDSKEYDVQSNATNRSNITSLKQFYDDTEFIEFLKNISLFVTSEDEGLYEGGNSKLFKNLQFLKDRFKEYKLKKTTQSYQSEYTNCLQTNRTIDSLYTPST
jgi:hypothetical protein